MKNNKYSKTKMLQFALLAFMLLVMYAFKNGTIANIENKQAEIKYANSSIEKDARFLIYVANINIAEMKFGQLAQQKSLMSDIKELGKMIETVHCNCMNNLTIVAKKKAIAIPTELNDNSNDAYEKLSNTSRTAFDNEYCIMMIRGHKAVIAEFKKEIKESNDEDIKQFATITLPLLQTQLDHATKCQRIE